MQGVFGQRGGCVLPALRSPVHVRSVRRQAQAVPHMQEQDTAGHQDVQELEVCRGSKRLEEEKQAN